MLVDNRSDPPNVCRAMWFSYRIRTKHLAGLCRRLATSVEAGIDLRTIWAREARQAVGPGMRTRLKTVSRAVDQGETLAAALAATADFFPPLFHEMIAVGEQTGRLAEVLDQLADHYYDVVKLRQTFLASITWPMAQLAIALFVVGLLIWILGAIGKTSGTQVDILGLGLAGSRGLLLYVAFLVVVVLLLLLIIHAMRRGLVWTRPIQRAVLRIPVLGSALEVLALAQLAWSLHLTFGTGMDVRRALRLSLRSTRNARYVDQIPEVDRSIVSGASVHDALAATGVYPAEFQDTLQVGEESGKLTEAMGMLSRQYRDRARMAMVVLTTLAGFAVWGVVALLIIMLIFRLFMFYLSAISDPMAL